MSEQPLGKVEPNSACGALPAVKKEKKVLTPERLEQLARARKKALEIRQAGAVVKEEQKQLANAALQEKLEAERRLNEAVKKSLIPNEINNDKLLTVPVYRNNVVPRLEGSDKHTSVNPPITQRVFNHEEEEEEEEEDGDRPIRDYTKASARRLPRKKPIRTKVVIEQSSDDEDEFHTNEHVIFVKRKSKNDSINKHTSVSKVVPVTTPVPPNSPEQPLSTNERVRDACLPPVYQKPALEMTNFLDMYANGGFVNRRKYY